MKRLRKTNTTSFHIKQDYQNVENNFWWLNLRKECLLSFKFQSKVLFHFNWLLRKVRKDIQQNFQLIFSKKSQKKILWYFITKVVLLLLFCQFACLTQVVKTVSEELKLSAQLNVSSLTRGILELLVKNKHWQLACKFCEYLQKYLCWKILY